jgi:hypothetical protein
VLFFRRAANIPLQGLGIGRVLAGRRDSAVPRRTNSASDCSKVCHPAAPRLDRGTALHRVPRLDVRGRCRGVDQDFEGRDPPPAHGGHQALRDDAAQRLGQLHAPEPAML